MAVPLVPLAPLVPALGGLEGIGPPGRVYIYLSNTSQSLYLSMHACMHVRMYACMAAKREENGNYQHASAMQVQGGACEESGSQRERETRVTASASKGECRAVLRMVVVGLFKK